mmetsp:Transcript_12209/g.18637  ORF Transcript_12209/g.18637 Transcript_12209/m.18637 type:complete len:237 (-) Transcript_12209:265-975(-)
MDLLHLHLLHTHHLQQRTTLCLQHPLTRTVLTLSVISLLGNNGGVFVLCQKHLGNSLDSKKCKLIEKSILVHSHSLLVITPKIIFIPLITDGGTNAENQIVVVIVREHAMQISGITPRNRISNGLHGKRFTSHRVRIQNQTQQPRRQILRNIFRKKKEGRQNLFILLDNGRSNVGIVPNFGTLSHLGQHQVLNLQLHMLGSLRIARVLRLQLDHQRRCFDRFSGVDQLLQTRHTLC